MMPSLSSDYSFLIQTTVWDEPEHDFAWELKNAINWNKWFRGESIYRFNTSTILSLKQDFKKLKRPNLVVPIGSVEFVHEYIRLNFGKNNVPKPINVPQELMTTDFCKRKIKNVSAGELTPGWFAKSNDLLKGFTGEFTGKEKLEGNYQTSELIDILSEWRVFVHRGKIVGLQNYSGDPFMVPSKSIILEMIDAYYPSPSSYTLDVAVINTGATVVIEVHNFYSCGLYGFRNYNILPIMFIDWWFQFTRSLEKT